MWRQSLISFMWFPSHVGLMAENCKRSEIVTMCSAVLRYNFCCATLYTAVSDMPKLWTCPAVGVRVYILLQIFTRFLVGLYYCISPYLAVQWTLWETFVVLRFLQSLGYCIPEQQLSTPVIKERDSGGI